VQIVVDHLFHHPDRIPLVASWIYSEFWADKAGYSAAKFEALLRQASDPNAIPLSLLAFVDGQPTGTINLIENDDQRRPHLYPWLAALFVAPEYRRKRVGTALIEVLVREAKRLGFSKMFLGTDQPSYYARIGAQFHEQASETLCILRLPVNE
jgi:predicted N-acetyltransferase YhbS